MIFNIIRCTMHHEPCFYFLPIKVSAFELHTKTGWTILSVLHWLHGRWILLCKFGIGYSGIKKRIQYISILYDEHWTQCKIHGIIALCITITSIVVHYETFFPNFFINKNASNAKHFLSDVRLNLMAFTIHMTNSNGQCSVILFTGQI